MAARAEFRALLREQVTDAEKAFEEALRAYEEARNTLYASYADLIAFRRALEAATRDSEFPYHPPPLSNPLDGPPPEEKKAEEVKPELVVKPKPKVEKATKKGIILKALASGNGSGMKLLDVLRAIPPDSPIKITKADLYRALPRLVDEERAWRDGRGFYHAGQPQTGTNAAEAFFGDIEVAD